MKKRILLVATILGMSVFTGCRMLPGTSRAEEMQAISNMRLLSLMATVNFLSGTE